MRLWADSGLWLTSLAAVLSTVVAGNVTELSAAFLQDLLDRYGENQVLALHQLKALLNRLDVGVGKAKLATEGNSANLSQCFSSAELFAAHSLTNSSRIDSHAFKNICPTVLQQLERGACVTENQENEEDEVTSEKKPTASEVWGYGILCVTVISLCSLIGASVVPFMRKTFYKRLLLYFIALAIGTLYSNALFQLIPEAFGFNPREDNYVSKSAVVFGGFYLFFFTEKILKMILKPKHKGSGHSHYKPEKYVTKSDLDEGVTEKLQNGDLNHIPTPKGRGLVSTAPGRGADPRSSLSLSLSLLAFSLLPLSGSVLIISAPLSLPPSLLFLSLCTISLSPWCQNLTPLLSLSLSLPLSISLSSSLPPSLSLSRQFPEMNEVSKDEDGEESQSLMVFALQNAGLLTGFIIMLLLTMYSGAIQIG
uniref:Metal cation symporter ZIP14 n=1 Tax=Callorhinchus milii TaxID=7868 RepID=A0A4W3I2H0_CALMI